jgi:hypothetical protein
MKLHKLASSIAILLFGMLASWSAWALVIDTGGCAEVTGLCVTISTVNADGTPFTTTLTGVAAVNLDADSPVGGPKSYGVFTIARCAGCSGRARVFISEGSIDKLVLTDAQITNTSTSNPSAALTIRVSSGLLTVSGPGGQYPYATELSGTFSAPFGAGLATDPANKIQVKASTNGNCGFEGFAPCLIDSPQLDAGETDSSQYSVVAPPFLSAGAATFAPKEQQNLPCFTATDPTNDGLALCQPALQLNIDVNLKSRHAARIPGSIGAFHVPTRCEPDKGLLEGCEIMTDFFASLGPKGFNVYDVRLEPSPGSQRNVDFRMGTPNSGEAWVTRRGVNEEDDRGSANGVVSTTRARLATNGSGEVKAIGLCPASGCPTSSVLPVRVYCGAGADQPVAVTGINLNSKGDGRATLSFSLPCADPAVLIMDEDDRFWVAAPAIL